MKRLLYIILYMVLAVHASAQMRVTGRVIDLQNKPVSDVIVKMVSGTKTLAFTSTNAKGEYALELKSATSGEVSLQFTHISYEKESERLSLKERVTKVDMVLTPKAVSLKEVTVKPDPLRQRGDTLSHNLASFLGKGDVTLEDGLKRLPGVDVSQNGGMRNHHSRRVEKDVPSNEVSMNIKLSNKAKFKPFGQEEAGAGIAPHSAPEGATIDPQHGNVSPSGDERGALRALLGLTGMMFTNKFQTICSVKGGNYKGFARADMYDHFGGLRTDSFTTMKVNADYSYHRATHDISQSTTYLADGGNYVTVSEQTSPLTKIHLPKLSVNYLKNADRVYLSETFVLKGKFEQNEGDVVANRWSSESHQARLDGRVVTEVDEVSGSLVEQRRKTSSFEVGNELFWMGRTEKGARRHVHANVSFKRTPTLRLSFVSDGNGYGQTAQSSTLSMNVGSSFQIPIGNV